jgi:hypothetical protein
MTAAQASATLSAHGATFVTVKDGVEWWRTQDGSWIAKQASYGGDVVLKKLPAHACSC